jgi:hypothetical protein
MRRIQRCMNCGDERDIVAHGLCSMCYQRRWREQQERELVLPDRSQRRYVAERNKDHGLLVGIVKLVDEAKCLSDQDRLIIKAIIQPHLLRHVMALAPPDGEDDSGLGGGSEVQMPDAEGGPSGTPDSVPMREPGGDAENESTVNDTDEVNHNPPGAAAMREPGDDFGSESTVDSGTEVNNNSGPPENFEEG